MAAITAVVLPGALPTPACAVGKPRISLVVERRTINVGSRAASVFDIRQADSTPGLARAPGQRFSASVLNCCREATIVQ